MSLHLLMVRKKSVLKSTACLYAYVRYEGDPEYYDEEPHEYPLEYTAQGCTDGNHPHAIDLGLPNGTKWC